MNTSSLESENADAPSVVDSEIGLRVSGRRKRRRWIRTLLLPGVVFGSLVVAVLLTQYEPPVYAVRIRNDHPADRKKLSSECFKAISSLIADLQTPQSWEATFEEDRFNAFLAEDFAQAHAQAMLPDELTELRISTSDDHLWLGCTYRWGGLKTILHLSVRVWVPKPNLLAVEIQDTRAGLLPLPASLARRGLERVARTSNIPISWRRHGRHLVALISLPSEKNEFVLQRVQVTQGGLTLRGVSGRAGLPVGDYGPTAN